MIVQPLQGSLPLGSAYSEFPPEQMGNLFIRLMRGVAKIDSYLMKSYGLRTAQKIKLECKRSKDLIKTILI